MNKKFDLEDYNKGLNPDNSFTIPHTFMDIFSVGEFVKRIGEEKYNLLVQSIKEAYQYGVQAGRTESPLYVVIPISILENKKLSANAKLLYGEILALAKKSGKCFATNSHLAEKLGLSERSVGQILNELEKFNLIKREIKRSVKGTYRNILISFFSQGGEEKLTWGGYANERGGGTLTNVPKREIDNKKLIKEENPETSFQVLPFEIKEEIQKLKNSPQRHIQLIGEFLEEKKVRLENKNQLNRAIKRHLRAARDLADFSDKQIALASEQAEKEYPKLWTLETLVKLITK